MVEAMGVDDRVARDAGATGERQDDGSGIVRPAQAAHEHDPGGDERDAATCQAEVAAPSDRR